MKASSTLQVALGARSYPIEIGQGLLSSYDLAAAIKGRKALIVSNETVAPLYLKQVAGLLPDRDVAHLVLPDGEQFKTIDSVSRILDALADAGAGRDSTVIALGGGVVGDIAGFAAACYMRGVSVVQVPTTLLAQVDSSVGGKTGVNHARGKNLIGAFHQPSLVLIDIDTLSTLPDRELIAGLAEVIKHAAIADAEFFAWLEQHIDGLLARDAAALTNAIQRCCEIKAAIVAEDEREQGKRALLNFGHTFGHAIENTLGYGAWLHGEAVAAGMVMAAALSDLQDGDRQRLQELIERAGLPVAPPDIPGTRLRAAMGMDKKAEGSRLRFILLRRIGEAFVEPNVSNEKLQRVLPSSAP